MAQKTFKKIKYEERLMNEINSIFRTHFSDSRFKFVSVTKVEISPDYSHAKVYWDTFDSTKRGDIKEALGHVTGKLRTLLASELKVRAVPTLQFYYDSQFESEQHIASILEAEARIGKGF